MVKVSLSDNNNNKSVVQMAFKLFFFFLFPTLAMVTNMRAQENQKRRLMTIIKKTPHQHQTKPERGRKYCLF